MPIDTFIDGDPVDITRVGDWVRRSLAHALAAAGDDAANSRLIADDGWDGETSDRYLGEASHLVHNIDTFHAAILDVADRFDGISAALSSALADMAEIRECASAAELSVVCNSIADPDPHSDDATRRAYEDAAAAAQDVHARWAREVAAVTSRWTNTAWAAAFTATTGLDYLTADLGVRVKKLATTADLLTRHSMRSMQAVLDLAPGSPYDEVRRLFGRAQDIADELATTTARHTELAHVPRTMGIAVGALGLVTGVGIDYYGGGESLEQAVVSNSAGLAASITAGALIGSAIPVVGTVAGAVAGTAVGIIAGGAVDHLYEHSSATLGTTFDAGINELSAAGDALRELGGLTTRLVDEE